MFNESQIEAWNLRFGQNPSHQMPDLGRFLNHRSVRSFSNQPVSEDLVLSLIGAAQSAATSSHLQLWSVVSIQDPELRSQIADVAGNQDQVRNAPWFFAFIADLNRVGRVANEEQSSFLEFTEYELMAVVDASLAAERMVCAAESLGLGICYIGAMRNNPMKVKELLNLPDRTFCPFGLCLGFPAEPMTAEIKPRLDQEAVWFKESYSNAGVDEFDKRMRAFYESQGMKGEFTWSMRSAKRLSALSGREVLKEFLESQRLGLR
ncbi:MAG: NADPH-dependent oxidoreductase [Fimbriimonadaceae bacterium]